MRFRIKTRSTDTGKERWEPYEKNIDDAEAWAEKTIKRFNSTLRPGESPREVLEVEVLEEDTRPDHTWEKVNLVSHDDGSDSYRCRVCGVTGRRRLLDGSVVLDYKYRRSKVYHRCDTAEEHIRKHGHPQG